MSDITFGEYLKKIRTSKEISINKLSSMSGISNAQISRIENGVRGVPKPETIEKLAKALNTSYVEMMVVAGYWDEEELLEPIGDSREIKETPNKYEKEFVESLELSDDKLLKQFKLKLDGKKLTEAEAKGVIAYLRSLRSIDNEK